MPFIKDHDVIQAISSDAAIEPLGVWVLPRATWCCQNLLNSHIRDARSEMVSIDAVTISK